MIGLGLLTRFARLDCRVNSAHRVSGSRRTSTCRCRDVIVKARGESPVAVVFDHHRRMTASPSQRVVVSQGSCAALKALFRRDESREGSLRRCVPDTAPSPATIADGLVHRAGPWNGLWGRAPFLVTTTYISSMSSTRERQRRIALRRRKRQVRRRRTVLVGVVVLLSAAIAILVKGGSGPVRGTSRREKQTAALFSLPGHLVAGPDLAPGSVPSALPSDLLIADRSNNRLLIVDPTGRIVWQFPRPGDLAPGQTFLIPDDAFFTPNGKDIIVTEEDNSVVSEVDIATHRIVWRYGSPGHPGSGLNELSNPDDAMMLPSGYLVLADIKNCSLLVLHPLSHVPFERIGENTTACYHAPPLRWGSPNGVFAMRDGTFLVTEINGDWVDDVTLGGAIVHWSAHPPGVAYPSDSNEVAPNRFLTADYSTPGQAVEFDARGNLLWRYGPASGPGALNQPSLCLPVPKRAEIVCNDDSNDRVIVVSTVTNRIVWQYGHDHLPGSAPGYLHQPDGMDFVPPLSFIGAQRSTVGKPSLTCNPSDPNGTCQVGAA